MMQLVSMMKVMMTRRPSYSYMYITMNQSIIATKDKLGCGQKRIILRYYRKPKRVGSWSQISSLNIEDTLNSLQKNMTQAKKILVKDSGERRVRDSVWAGRPQAMVHADGTAKRLETNTASEGD